MRPEGLDSQAFGAYSDTDLVEGESVRLSASSRHTIATAELPATADNSGLVTVLTSALASSLLMDRSVVSYSCMARCYGYEGGKSGGGLTRTLTSAGIAAAAATRRARMLRVFIFIGNNGPEIIESR